MLRLENQNIANPSNLKDEYTGAVPLAPVQWLKVFINLFTTYVYGELPVTINILKLLGKSISQKALREFLGKVSKL